MPESIINNKTEQNIKNYLEQKGKKATTAEIGDILPSNTGKNRNKKKMVFAVIVVLIAAVSAAAYISFNKGQNSFDETKVKIEMAAAAEVSSGEEISLEVSYKNNTEVELSNAKLSLSVPDSFRFVSSDINPKREKAVLSWTFDKIPKEKSGKVRIFGKLIGKKDSEHKFNSIFTYRPSNINSEYKAEATRSIKISFIPVELSIRSDETVNIGDGMEFSIHYKNISDRKFANLKIRAVVPGGFEYGTSSPGASEIKNDYIAWDVSNVESGAEADLSLKGKLSGQKDEEKEFKAQISVLEDDIMFDYDSIAVAVKMSEVPIVITQTVNGESDPAVDKNSELEYKVKFKNIGSNEIKGLIVNGELEGNFDMNSVNVRNGSFDGKNKITWSAFNVPKLAVLGPGEEDEVNFKVRVKDIFGIGSPSDKNFVIKNKVSIKNFNFNSGSSEIGKTIAENISEVKIRAYPVIKQTAFYNDDHRILNTGLIPPEVGEETAYTVHWNLSNLFNDVSNIRIATVLPGHVNWTGNFITSDGKVSLGEATNGSRTPESIDPMTIGEIRGGFGDNRLGISYDWFDSTVKKSDKAVGLPIGFVAGDKLVFTYSDDKIKETGSCIITENEQYKGHYYSCQVPWTVKLTSYAVNSNYRIQKAVLRIEKEDLYYNEAAREVIWEIPNIEANMGISSPAKEVVFQLGVTPKEGDQGSTVLVVDKVSVSGYDEFTSDEVSNVDGEIKTDLPDDESIGTDEGIVLAPLDGGNIEDEEVPVP